MGKDKMSPGTRLTQLASERPDAIALILQKMDGSDERLTWMQLERWANRLAHRLSERSAGPGSFIAIHLPNCLEHVVATLAAYKLGACPMPISHRMPATERDQMLALSTPTAVISDAPDLEGISRAQLRSLDRYPDAPLPNAIPQPFKAIASGGSTGKPKLIVSPGAFHYAADDYPFATLLGIVDGDRLYSPGPLYHNQAFLFTQAALFVGASAVLNEKFDAEQSLSAIVRHRPSVLNVVPTMMLRMLRAASFQASDLRSLRRLWHLAAPCPDWVKRAWIERLGASKVYELWASTEITGITVISGAEWLERPGSVGKGYHTEIRILDARRCPVPPMEIGEIFTRAWGGPPQYRYLGAPELETVGTDFASVGDLGYVDEDGYLYLSDRRVDLIISGGANVIPAEVEAILTQHPEVRDAVVIGVKDEDLGRRVHALIEPTSEDRCPGQDDLDRHVRAHLASYKVPRGYEFLTALPRDEAGKIRRSKLRDERGG
ncbi:AMP-binding protein [Solimonas terrae]|uniref:AMP-binding protein n=1 Tax=Solimonas terrae TaxID=1396819 RepID=A0A6M2BPZ3_9GAMM|nr:AMP-binding protein [Solimonas terrae]NGY04153.1 AMP-binding protein [Solimonas terrae]